MMRDAQSGFRRAAFALAVAVLAATAACGGDRGEDGGAARGASKSDAPGDVERGGTAIMAEISDIDKPLPFVYEGVVDADMVDMMYMPLLRGVWRDGRLVSVTSNDNPMSLAWHWEYARPDSAAIRFRMRSALRWSDGQPVTARDVVWTYDMIRDPRVASPRQDYVEQLDSVVAENDSTVVFHFKRRYPEMLFHAAIPIAPRHAYEGTDPAQIRTHPRLTRPDSGNLVVSGPFMIGSWRQGQQVTLVPNPHFPVRPNLDQIVIRVIPEATTRLVELETGRVDFARPIPADQVPRLRQQAPDVRFEREEKRYFDLIAWNPRTLDGAFGDPEIRRALGMGMDVRAIIRALQMEEFAVPAGGPYSPIFKDLHDPERMAPLPYDTAAAIRILESKGWRDTDGDGVREKNGKPFRFTLVTNAGNQRKADVQQIVQQQLKRIGVDVRLQQMEFNSMQDRVMKKNFEAVLWNWGVGLSPDLSEMWGKGSPYNFVSYENPRMSQLFEQALAQPTEQQAAPYWRAAAAEIARDQPYTFLYFMDQVDGVRDRLKGIKIDTYGAYQNAWEWWIPRDQQGAQAQRGDTARR